MSSTDLDGDGVIDAIDYDPNDPDVYADPRIPYDGEPFKYVITKEVKDISGNVLYMEIYTDRGDTFRYGDSNAESDMYAGLIDGEIITKNSPTSEFEWNNSNDVYDGFGLGLTLDTLNLDFPNNQQTITVAYTGGSTGQAQGLEPGFDNAGNTLETDYLEDIVSNTKTIGDNQQDIADQIYNLRDVNTKENRDIKELLDKIEKNTKNSGSSGSIIVDIDEQAIGEAVGNEIESINEQGALEAETAKDNELQNLDNHISTLEFDGEIKPEDIPQEEDLPGIFDTYITNNPVVQALNNSGIAVSNQFCSIDFEWKGHTIPLSICDYEDTLNYIGIIMLGIAGLASLIIVVRG